jgi:hypothetical protein
MLFAIPFAMRQQMTDVPAETSCLCSSLIDCRGRNSLKRRTKTHKDTDNFFLSIELA